MTTATLVLGVGFLFAPVGVSAVNVYNDCTGTNADTAVCKGKSDSVGGLMKTVINTLLFLIGIVSVVVVIIGGFMYVTSTGDASNVTKARNTITYALVGLAIAFLAYAIVNWVLKIFG